MERTIQEYLKKPYARILIPSEEGGFSAEILEFPGCFAEGETADEAIRELDEAAKSWIEAALKQGQNIPEPSSNQGFSGRLALRLPRSIHRQAARMAERDDTSLNQFLLSAISARIGAENIYAYIDEKLEQRLRAALSQFTGCLIQVNDPTINVNFTELKITDAKPLEVVSHA